MAINKLLFIPEWRTTATVSYPEANYKLLYPKSTDDYWYFVSSDGTEKRIETGLDFKNGITTTTLATSSLMRAQLDIALGVGLTFAGNYAGSTISVFGVTPDMLSSVGSGTAGYVLTSNGSNFSWVTPSSLIAGISGSTNRISKFTSPTTLGDSIMTDDGSRVVIGATPTFVSAAMNIDGNAYISGDIYLTDSLSTFIRFANGILVQSNQNIIFTDDFGYNYLDLSTDNISSYTFSILENTVLLGDDGSYKYLVSNDVNSVIFGNTSSTLTYSIFSNTPGVLRIQDSSEGVDKIFVSDTNGYGTWQNLNSGLGLTVSGLTYSVLADNGLSIIGSSVSLGGTLSQTTTINANSFDLIVNSASTILFNTSTFDVEADGFVSIDAGSGSVQIIGDDTIILTASNSVDIVTSGTFDVLFNQSTVTDNSGNGFGMVYANDYSATFVTNSLVSKLYVDSQVMSGPTGLAGATGPQGTTGSQGPTGPQGETGSSMLGMYYKELISGGAVYNSGLTFDVSLLTYTFYGPVQTTLGATQVTFATGDPTYSRIDALVVNNDQPNGLVSIIQGSASPSPITPEIPVDELLVQYVIIPSSATALSFNEDFIYNENLEWTFSAYDTGGGVPLGTFSPTASTPTPYFGTKCLRITNNNRRRGARFTRVTTLQAADYTSISFAVYFSQVIPNGRSLLIGLRNGQNVTLPLTLTPTFVSKNIVGSWQLVVVPLYLFNLTGEFDGVDILLGGSDTSTLDWALDYIRVQGGNAPTYLSGGAVSTVVAGIGLTGGGTTNTVTLDVNVGNGISIVNDTVFLGGTISQNTTITNSANFGLLSTNGFTGLRMNDSAQVSLIGYSDGSTTFSFYRSLESESTIQAIGPSGGFDLTFDSLNQTAVLTDSTSTPKGLQYSNDYSSNFVTYSLVDKNYVDTLVSGGSGVLGVTAGSGLTGGGTSSYITLSLDTIIPDSRIFTGSVTVSNNFSVTGSTVLNNLTASNTYISSTGSDTLILYSSGTGSTIFRVQGRSGELFSVVDGLTGSLFSVNNISGLPILEVFSDDTVLLGDYVAPSLNTTVKITAVTGSNTIYSIDKSLYTGAFFEYTLTKGTNARAGSIMSVWNGTTASFTQSSTLDIGLTTDVEFYVTATGSDAVLTASASSNNWIIKTIVRSI